MINYLDEAKELFSYCQDLRRDFHQHPELGFEEYRTAKIVAKELRKLDLDSVQTGVAKTGVVGLLEGSKPGPVVLLRFDMDALPMTEESDSDYASKIPGVMHACGHDGHTAVGLTTAKMLAAHKGDLAGTVKFVFQPAEEGLGGAELMVKEGVLENPKPDYSLAIHVWNDKPLDWLGITPGPMMAAAETFEVKITGKGGHGAAPHHAIDPILAASQIITALQSIVSRNVAPLESAVVSVCSIQSGSAFNIIPPTTTMQGTIRTFRPEIRETVHNRIQEIVQGVSKSMGCESEIKLCSITPTVYNDPELAGLVMKNAAQLFPDDVLDDKAMTMGSEDFAFMMEGVQGCFVFVGSANPTKGLDAMHHHPKFDFDEIALTQAAALIATVPAELLPVT